MAVDALTIGLSVAVFLAILVTIFRLAFRLKIQRFWWEDMWAAVAMLAAMVFTTVPLIYCNTDTFELAKVAPWIFACVFPSIVWSVRLSLLCSIVRVVPPSTCLHNFTRAIGILFVVVWASTVILKIQWCVSDAKSAFRHSTCGLPNATAIFEVTAAFTGDAALVILSLRLLWRVKLSRRRRRMILSIFSSSAIMSIITSPHAIPQIAYKRDLQDIIGNLEVIMSLIICNLLVVVTYTYRVYLGSSESESSSEDDDFSTPVSRSPQSLTTVDLNASDPTTTGATNYLSGSFLPSQTSVAS